MKLQYPPIRAGLIVSNDSVSTVWWVCQIPAGLIFEGPSAFDRGSVDEVAGDSVFRGWEDMGAELTSAELLAVFEAGAPGTPGAWTGARCEQCGTVQAGDECSGCAASATERELAGAMSGADVEPF